MTAAPPPGKTEIVDGISFYCEVHGHGVPLLLLHGFSGSGQDWLPTLPLWGDGFQLVVPDLRGHGRSGTLSRPFRHDQAAGDVLALLDRLGVGAVCAVGISAGANVMLHLATRQPSRVNAMVLVSATPYFPDQARAIMRSYGDNLSEQQRELLRQRHPGGDAQIQALLESTKSFADSYDDLNFTPRLLSRIRARTLIVQGDRDPLYPVELSVEMVRAIPSSALWIIPESGHGPVLGRRWAEFIGTAVEFLKG